jgi:UDP-glucose 4-epimerase
MKVLVTGGAGFIGSHLVEHALKAGHEVAVLDNLSTGKRQNVPRKAELFEIDLRDRAGVLGVLKEVRPTAVSHQAAQASVAVSMRDPQFDVAVNIVGGINLLDACLATGVRRVVFASTGGAMYGNVPEGKRAPEETRPAPISPYAISKLCFEQLLRVYRTQHGLESTVLRYANVYGPRQDPHGEAGVVAIFCNRLLRSDRLCINARRTVGDAGCVRDYVFVDDVVRANLGALEGRLLERLVNVATGQPTSTRELATRLALIARLEVPEEPAFDAGPPRPGDLEYTVLDITRFRLAFGPPIPLEQGLRKTYDWFRQANRGHQAPERGERSHNEGASLGNS